MKAGIFVKRKEAYNYRIIANSESNRQQGVLISRKGANQNKGDVRIYFKTERMYLREWCP